MDNPLKKIIQQGQDFFSKAKVESVLGIDIGSSSIKLVQMKKKNGRAVLETYGSLALGPYAGLDVGEITNLPADKLATALTDAIRETNANAPRGAFAIPNSASLIFMIELPKAIKEEEYPVVVPTEARKYIPVPITEVTLDYSAIPALSIDAMPGEEVPVEPKNEILVAAIHNDILAKYNDIVKRVQLKSDFFEIETFCSVRSSLSHELAPTLLVDFGASKTKLAIVEYGAARRFRVVNRGSHDITRGIVQGMNFPFAAAEEYKRTHGLNAPDATVLEIIRLTLDYIFSEINTVVLEYEKKYNRAINKVILSGGGALIPGMYDYAIGNFQCEVVMSDPFSKVEAPAFLGDVLKTGGPEFGVALGIGLRDIS